MKKIVYICSRVERSLTYFLFLSALVATLSGCSGLYQLNRAVAYEIRYNKEQHTDTNLNLQISNEPARSN